MKRGKIIHLAIGGILLGIVTHLFVQSTSTDPQDHVRILETFNALNQSETDLRRNLLLVRGDLMLHYDTVNQAMAELHQHLDDLRRAAMKGSEAATAELGVRFAAIEVNLARDEELVEQFKWNNALLRNSWSYFAQKSGSLSRLAAQRPQADGAIQAMVNQLLPTMLLVQHEPHSRATELAAADLTHLDHLSAPEWLAPHIESMVKHGRLILRLAPEMDSTLTSLLTSQTSELVNALRKAYLADHQQSVYRAERHRILLYAFSLLLLAYLAYLFIRLQAGARALVRSNATKMLEIAERKQAEDRARELQTELAHAHRLSLMGEMASSMAHELNQPLTAIRLYAKGCARRLKSGEGSREEILDALNQLSGQVLRAGEILGWIRGFARKRQPCTSEIDVNALIRETVGLLSYEQKGLQISIGLELSEPLPPVEADKTQVQQVVLNLIRNSIESMSEDGSRPARMIIRTSQGPRNVVEVEVEDSGPGMPVRVLEQAFDSFFTTKPHGMGLGLAICRSMVEAHGGKLWAISEEGVGSHFYFTLKVAGEDSDDGIDDRLDCTADVDCGRRSQDRGVASDRSVA